MNYGLQYDMDRCPSCGSEVREDQVICVKCGVQLRALKVEREWEREKEGEGNSHWYIWVIVPVVLSFIVMMLVMFVLPMFGA